MRKIRVLHITPSLAGGGAERMISKICEYDDKNEHIVISLLNLPLHYEIKNAKVINLNMSNSYLNKILVIPKIYKIIKKIQPDVIQTWMKANFYGPIIKKKTGIPILSNFRNGFHGISNKFIIKVYNKYFENFNGHIFVSNSTLKERENVGMKFKNSHIINNGFILTDIQEIENRKNFVIGHMSRYHPIKNQQLIVNAFRNFAVDKSDVKLILAGRDLNEKNLNLKGIPNNKINVQGELKNSEQFYLSIDLFILTSDSEGFPNVIGEAMSFGVPVLTTNAGESFNIIKNTGYKLKEANLVDLEELLNDIYNNKVYHNELKLKARSRIKDCYSLDKTIGRYQKIYKEIGEG